MEKSMVIVTENPLDPGTLFEKTGKRDAGSLIFHYAAVKNQSGSMPTSGIRFEIQGDPQSELSEIEADIRTRWNISDILLVRRTGTLKIGDLISLVAVSSPASSDAFEACRYGLERLKKVSGFKKTELYLD